MTIYKRPNSTDIELNDEPETIAKAKEMGWIAYDPIAEAKKAGKAEAKAEAAAKKKAK